MASRRYVPLKQVPEQLGYEWVTERLLRRLVYERRVAHTKPTNRVLIDLDDLDDLLEACRQEPTR